MLSRQGFLRAATPFFYSSVRRRCSQGDAQRLPASFNDPPPGAARRRQVRRVRRVTRPVAAVAGPRGVAPGAAEGGVGSVNKGGGIIPALPSLQVVYRSSLRAVRAQQPSTGDLLQDAGRWLVWLIVVIVQAAC